MQNYTPEQEADIQKRVDDAIVYLKGVQLIPEAAVQAVLVGEGMFATKVIPFLMDTKFTKGKEILPEGETNPVETNATTDTK